MDIEKYSQTTPQFYDTALPPLLRRYLDLNEYQSLLDCGCGDGSLLYALNEGGYFREKKVFAVDLSLNRIRLVRQIDDRINAHVDNAELLSTIPDNSIDFFISTQVIEHISDSAFVRTIGRVVKENGMVYLSTVYKKWYGWYFYRNQGAWVLDPTHVREYRSDDELLSLFPRDTFALLESRKRLMWFPIFDFVLKKLSVRDRHLYKNPVTAFLRRVKFPVIGYYNWEIVLRKKPSVSL